MNNHDLCWIYDNNIVWKKAYIKEKNKSLAIIFDEKNIEKEVNISEILLRNSDDDDHCNNLIDLMHLNEGSILNSIYTRYLSDSIYTFNNDILIAVNPFKNLDIYSEKFINLYETNSDNLEPHPFYIAKNSVIDLKKSDRNQSILVSGESGAGKTQTTKILMNYITNISKTNLKNIENKILSSNPILEAFGNAKTLRNNNSSRFGKFIKILFNDNNELVGGKIKTYLLEKIRITNLSKNERNFHIFYILVNSLNIETKKQLYINNELDEYNYLNKSNKYFRSDNVDDKNEYKLLMNSFTLLNFTKDNVLNIFKIISFILNLGNIDSITNIDNNIFLHNCTNILGLNEHILKDIFLYKYLSINNEIIKINNTNEDFIITRDTLAQKLYILLFDYIVNKINLSIENNFTKYIGILDIFGFEVFDNNGFEQLCINYTNEKLQNLFNKFIFELEQKEYESEGIIWENIKYPNNKKILNVIENKSKSLFSILMEQSILKSGNDDNFYNSIVNKLDNYANFEVLNKQIVKKQFNIKHYAGKVTYKVKNFIFKNKNLADNRLKNLLKDNLFIYENFNLKNLNSCSKTINANSVIYQFKSQLNQLTSNILKTNQHYIRCIKPNDNDLKDNFMHKRVFEQLKYCGVLEAIKIARAGYPIRIKNNEFINKFFTSMNALKLNPIISNIKSFIKKIYPSLNDSVMQIGKTKVFLKKILYEILINRNNSDLNYYSKMIQKHYRKYILNKKFKIFKKFCILIQYLVKKFIKIKTNKIEIIKKYISGYIIRKLYIIKKVNSVNIQKIIRKYIARKKYIIFLTTRRIQSFIRMYIRKKKYTKMIKIIKSCNKIQKQYKVYIFRKIVKEKLIKLLDIRNKVSLLQKQLLSEQEEFKNRLKIEKEKQKEKLLFTLKIEKEKQKEEFLKVLNEEKNKQIVEIKKIIEIEKEKQKEEFLKVLNEEKTKQREEYLKKLNREIKKNQENENHTMKQTKRTNAIIGNKMEELYLKLEKSNEELYKIKNLYKTKNEKCAVM